MPAVLAGRDGKFTVLVGRNAAGAFRVVDPVTRIVEEVEPEAVLQRAGKVLLIQRRMGGKGIDPSSFSLRWFLPSIWRYRIPLGHVLVASLSVQILALVSPLFFQVVVDKVLVHKGYQTLYVLVIGLAVVGIFDVVLQYLRSYALAHTTSRIDVELGRRLFAHLFRLPMAYFETRAAGQTSSGSPTRSFVWVSGS